MGAFFDALRALRARSRDKPADAPAGAAAPIGRDDFHDAMEQALQRCDDTAGQAALLYVGVDNFRPLNEGYGLKVGDAVLAEVGRRLAAVAGPEGRVSRVGGDEFVVLATDNADAATALADAVMASAQQPFKVGALQLVLSVSVGVALYPQHASKPRLMSHAALAMRTAKLGGGAAYAMFHPSMAVDLREQAELAQDLRQAVQRRQLQLVYQPKVDARSLQVTAAEALLRWQHPQRGLVGPAVFVPVAERHGLMREIGLWVIEEACRQAGEWRKQGLRMRVAVNISGQQMRQHDTVSRIEECVRRHDVRPERITCEITESVAMEDTAHTRKAFERLRRAGLHVSIDDFGTGHSSLAALRRLPAAELKIDRAFVTDLETSADARSIAQAIVQMAHSLELRVVAEGVETAAQRDLLVQMGCDELQGFLFARPMSARAVTLWAADDDRPDGSRAFRASLFQPTTDAPS
jgi:diguanylate cyclase (GGDEF)-like protein